MVCRPGLQHDHPGFEHPVAVVAAVDAAVVAVAVAAAAGAGAGRAEIESEDSGKRSFPWRATDAAGAVDPRSPSSCKEGRG